MSFEKDDLERAKFADLLISLSAGLATASVLPACRVIAVDAPWGSGKSWIAKQLPEHFANDKRVGKCVYIDAFEFDYHQDPFAVVTSAILDGYKTETVAVKNLKDTAVSILKVTLPAVGKEIVKAGINYAGIDEKFVESINKAGEAASEKAISKMLDTFTKTIETTKTFKTKLDALVKTNKEEAPLVVVIDELDRCRPSFALEMLERVKHLFDIQNVVFIFFAHSPALHSAICKTYGNDINPSEYLRKFIALTIGLPNAVKPIPTYLDKENFARKFINSRYPLLNVKNANDDKFRHALAIFSSKFDVTFRDLENIMLFWDILNLTIVDSYFFAAYFLLVRIKDQRQIIELKNSSINAYEREIARLGKFSDSENHYITHIRDMFLYAAEPTIFKNAPSQNSLKLKSGKTEIDNRQDLYMAHKIIAALELEYVRL